MTYSGASAGIVSSPIDAKEIDATVNGEETNESKMIRLYESGATFAKIGEVLGVKTAIAASRIYSLVSKGLVKKQFRHKTHHKRRPI